MIDDLSQVLSEFFPRSVAQNPATGIKPPFVPVIETLELTGRRFTEQLRQPQQDPITNRAFPPNPDIVSLTPTSGPVAGGTSVAITGNRFISEAIVKFGGVLEAPGGTFTDEHHINSITPAHAAGAVDVLVENVPGLSDTLVGGFTFLADPFISSVVNDWGNVTGGTAVTINGGNFVNGATVSFDSIAASGVVFVNSGRLTCFTPANGFGLADVRVRNPTGQIALMTGGFRYQNAPGPFIERGDCVPPRGFIHVNTLVLFTFDCPTDPGYRGILHLRFFTSACTIFAPTDVTMRDGTVQFFVQAAFPTAINPSYEFFIEDTFYDPAFNFGRSFIINVQNP